MGIFESIKSAFGKADTAMDEQAAPPNPEPAVTPEPEPEPSAQATFEAGEAQTYTVQTGDTLWRVAERVYGNGSNYKAIFEANRESLETPDQILPGQKLIIPAL